MVAGRYDPQTAVAVGYVHGDPLEGVEGGRDGAAALTQFVNVAMDTYDEPLRSSLVESLEADGVRRLLHLRDATEAEITVLPSWTKHLAREFLREADTMLRVMGWRVAEVVVAQAQPEVVVTTGTRHRDRPFPKPPTAIDSAHVGWGPWGVGRAPVDWGYTTPGWAAEFCAEGAKAKQALREVLENPVPGVAQVQKIVVGVADEALLLQRFLEVLEPEQLDWLGPALVRGVSFIDALVKIVGRRHGKERDRKKSALDKILELQDVEHIGGLGQWLNDYERRIQTAEHEGCLVSEEIQMSVLGRIMVKSCTGARERAEHIEQYEGGTKVSPELLLDLYQSEVGKYEKDKEKRKERKVEPKPEIRTNKKKGKQPFQKPKQQLALEGPKAAAAAPKPKGKGVCYRWEKKGECHFGAGCHFEHDEANPTSGKPKSFMAMTAEEENPQFEDCEEEESDEEEPFTGLAALILGLLLGLVAEGCEWLGNARSNPRVVPGKTDGGEQKGSASEVANTTRPSNSNPKDHNPSIQPESLWYNTILDIGATCDVIGRQAMDWATIGDRKDVVELETVSDTIPVTKEGDWTISGALRMAKSLVVPQSVYSLVSLPTRLLQGWKWQAGGSEAVLESPEGETHKFTMEQGLFRYKGKQKSRGCKSGQGGARGHKKKQAAEQAEKTRRHMLAARKKNQSEKSYSVKQKVLKPNKADSWMKWTAGAQRLWNDSKIGNMVLGILLLVSSSLCQLGGAEGAILEKLSKEWDPSKRNADEKKPKRKMSEAVKAQKLKRGKDCDGRIHKQWGHLPHDSTCDACRRARQTMKKNTRNDNPRDIEYANKGYVLGIDLFGPFEDDVDGNEWALIGVEVGHSDYTMVRLLRTKSAKEVSQAVKSMKLELKTKGATNMEVVRLHSDFDPSFQSEVRQCLLDEQVLQTDTGGYRPQNNSRTERRIRMLTEVVKANLLVAGGGLTEYDSLWGPALLFAADRVNHKVFEDGRVPIQELTGKEPTLVARDNAFGEQGSVHIPRAKRTTKWQASGGRCIWVGKSSVVPDGHKIVPIHVEWDPTINAWKMGNTEQVASLKVIEDSYILREGPNGFVTPSEQEFYERSNLAKYHVTPDVTEEQVDPGHDPVMVVEEITGHKGKGKQRRYRIRWQGSTKETYEPVHHLTGCENILRE